MGLLSLLLHDPILFVIVVPALLYSIIFHEVAHGYVAGLFGDDTARRYGRLALNPIPHLDLIGALMLLIAGFGWAKPVPVNYNAFRNSQTGIIAVSLAGCFTNFLIATIALFLLQFPSVSALSPVATMLAVLAKINIMLGAFNLIPIPPLDGSRVLMASLPRDLQYSLARLEPYGFFIIVILLFTGILNLVISFIQNVIYGFIEVLFSLMHLHKG